MPTLAVADTDKQVLKGLERDLEGKFKLQRSLVILKETMRGFGL